MKLQIMNAVLFLSLSQFSFAALYQKPNSCPSVSALQAVGINEMIKEQGLWYGAVKSSDYDTMDKWTFVIGAFRATDENNAKQKALEAVNSITFQKGPEGININGEEHWVCLYNDNSGHHAATITPTISYLHSWIIHN